MRRKIPDTKRSPFHRKRDREDALPFPATPLRRSALRKLWSILLERRDLPNTQYLPENDTPE